MEHFVELYVFSHANPHNETHGYAQGGKARRKVGK